MNELNEVKKIRAILGVTEQHIDRLLSLLEKNEPREPLGGRGENQ